MINDYSQRAMAHIHFLAETIGGRGSCTSQERQAAEYVYQKLCEVGAGGVGFESFQGAPSTYRPYLLAFGAALLGTVLALAVGNGPAFGAAILLNALGGWAMLAETDFSGHWARWLLPKAPTQNLVAAIPPSGPVRCRAVLCAHLDTHRTPVFYSSKTWHKIFGLLVSGAFLSMVAASVVFGLALLLGWGWLRWAGLLIVPLQAFVLVMVVHADFTPFSPGANDNASGAGVILGLALRVVKEPLEGTEIHLVFTDCEETASYGVIAYLDAHARALGDDAIYLILDEVGLGSVSYLSADGLVIKHRTHPKALELARQVASRADFSVLERVGLAYTDALPVTKRGLVALTLSSIAPPNSEAASHWHQMSDRPEFVVPQSLEEAHQFTWDLLQAIDRESAPEQIMGKEWELSE